MGWTGEHREKGQNDKVYFQKEVFGDAFEVLDTARNGTTVFLKVKNIKRNETFACVVLTRMGRGYFNFYRKEVSEDMGPYEIQCPLRILDGLSEPSNEYARQWRERVRKWNAEKSPKAKVGNVLKFSEPLEFGNGYKLDTFKLISAGKNRLRFVSPLAQKPFSTFYKIRNWRNLQYAIIG